MLARGLNWALQETGMQQFWYGKKWSLTSSTHQPQNWCGSKFLNQFLGYQQMQL
jgi:hypothetical protein